MAIPSLIKKYFGGDEQERTSTLPSLPILPKVTDIPTVEQAPQLVSKKEERPLTPIQKTIADMTTEEKWQATGQFTKDIVQAFTVPIAKVLVTGEQLLETGVSALRRGEKPTKVEQIAREPVRVPKVLQPVLGEEISSHVKDVFADIGQGMNPIKAFLKGGLFFTWDATIVGSLLRWGNKAILEGIKVPDTPHKLAWEMFKKAPTQEEALKIADEYLKEVSPNSARANRLGTVDEGATKAITDARNIIKERGIPKEPPHPLNVLRDIAQMLETPIEELSQLRSAEPFFSIAGELPGTRPLGGEPQPRFGLSIEPVEPVGKPAKIVDDFVKRLKDEAKIMRERAIHATQEDEVQHMEQIAQDIKQGIELQKQDIALLKRRNIEIPAQIPISVPSEQAGDIVAARIQGKGLKAFQGFKDFTTQFLEYAKGKTTLSKQEILDFARRPELRKGEADLLNRLGSELKGDKVSAQEFADSIRRDLLELKPVKVKEPQYRHTSIEGNKRNAKGELLGKNYEEIVFESPIETNGSSHFPNSKNYFAHARGDEVVEGGKKIWREQEIQSDLLQKEGLDKIESLSKADQLGTTDLVLRERLFRELPKKEAQKEWETILDKRSIAEKQYRTQARRELEQLNPFTNDRFGERIMRERIREKAQKGYEKYRLPTGETIGKIEGFEPNQWIDVGLREKIGYGDDQAYRLKSENLKVGMEIQSYGNFGDRWIVTDILGDGRFKAVSKKDYSLIIKEFGDKAKNNLAKYTPPQLAETFDLTGKSNPQAKRYENWGKFLKNKFGGKEITDSQGNTWVEVDLKKEMGGTPVEAFGAVAGFEQDEETGELKFNPKKAVLGIGLIHGFRNPFVRKQIVKELEVLHTFDKQNLSKAVVKALAEFKPTEELTLFRSKSVGSNFWTRDEKIAKLYDPNGETISQTFKPEQIIFDSQSLPTDIKQEVYKRATSEMVEEGLSQEEAMRRATNGGEVLVKGATDELNDLLEAAKPARRELGEKFAQERARRASEVEDRIETIGGEQGYVEALKALKGELVGKEEKIVFEPLKEKMAPEKVDELYNQIWQHPYLTTYEKISSANELTKLLSGEIPTPKGLVFLEEIYGQDLIKNVLSKRALGYKILDNVIETANALKTIVSTAEMSGTLRQGAIEVAAHPIIATQAISKTFQFAFSPQSFEAYFKALPSEPLYKVMRESGLAMTNPARIATGATAREEAFVSRLLQKIPIIGHIFRFAERAYVGFLTKLRVDVFKQTANELISKGFSPIKDREIFKNSAEVINTFTGRGQLPFGLDKAAPALNTLFFSPRLLAARFNALNPYWYMRMPPPVRRKAIVDFAKFVGVGMSILTLASLNDDVEVEADPRSSDFGKIKIGNTRWDIWGGFVQWARVFAQLATGERKDIKTGEIISLTKDEYPFTTRKEILLRFVEGKLAPMPALINELMSGSKTYQGEDLTFEKALKERAIPFYIQDIADAYADGGLGSAIGVGIPAFFGVGVQTYEEKKKKTTLPTTPHAPTLPSLPTLPKLPRLPK